MAGNLFLKRIYSEEKTRKEYSRVFKVYNIWSRLFESKAAKKVIELADIKNGETILEAAVGTGILFEKIAGLNSKGMTEGIDLSPKMLSLAAKRLKYFPQNNYRLQAGSVYNLPYGDYKFDLIINNYMFDLLPEEDFLKILYEFARVLKKDGRIVISTMTFGRKWFNKPWVKISEWFPSMMTGCRPVQLSEYIRNAGFTVTNSINVSQNSFPSEIIKAFKQRP